MKKIDLNRILTVYKLNKKEVASQLFPNNKYPVLAFGRVISGESKLDSEQMSKLALLAGIDIQDLYGQQFYMSRDKNVINFKTGDFTAEYDIDTNVTKIFHNDSLFHEEILHKPYVKLNEYIDNLKYTINQYENEKQSN